MIVQHVADKIQCRRQEFSFGVLQPMRPGDGSLQWGPGTKHRYGVWRTQKLKQFSDIVYRFWLQNRSRFENFAQLTSWFSIRMFHGGTKRHFWELSSSLMSCAANDRIATETVEQQMSFCYLSY